MPGDRAISMSSFFTKIFFFLLPAFSCFCAGAQVKFSASVSPRTAGKDEYITLKLTVANCSNIQEIIPPSFKDFSVVSGPNHETEMNSVNGITKQYVSLSYILLPNKTGTMSLGTATAVADGKTYKTAPVEVTVSHKRSARGSQPNNLSSLLQIPLTAFDRMSPPHRETQFDDYVLRDGENIPDKVSRNMQLKLQTDKTSCFVGEPLLATYKLYTRLRSESNLSQNPSFSGFSVVDMMKQDDPVISETETLNGREYNVYTIRKAQLYPLQAGPAQLEIASLENKIAFLKNSFNAGNLVTENVTLSSKPVTINVKPLPEQGKPANFTGAVGKFAVSASLEKNSFTTDETGKLLVTITGRGNLQLLTPPPITWPAGFEAFDNKLTDNTDNTTIPLSGSKTFEIPFAVQQPGSYSTPAVSFSYFDPAAAVYKTISAPRISFSVVQGTGTGANKFVAKPKTGKAPSDNTGSYTGLILMLLACLACAGAIYALRKNRKEKVPVKISESEEITALLGKPTVSPEEIRASMPFQTNPLSRTEDCLQKENCTEFYAILNAEMKHFLARRFAIPEAMLTCKGLSAAMDKAGVDNNVSLQTHELLQDIHQELYMPYERSEKLNEMYARALMIVEMPGMRVG